MERHTPAARDVPPPPPPTIDLRRDQKFSWPRCIIAIISYALLASDVLRSGVGIQDFTEYFTTQPDVFITFGPYAYPIIHLTVDNATDDAFHRLWPYKYDTTSVAMRSMAEHLELSAWPPCVFYKAQCDEKKGLEYSTIFSMIDSLVASVADRGNRRLEPKTVNPSGQVSLRVESIFRDRLHDYFLPWIFSDTVKRTVQAVHFDYDSTRTQTTICGRTRPQPYSCDAVWAKYINGFCGRPGLPTCRDTLWTDIRRRLEDLSHVYPNHTIDFIVLDSVDDNFGGALVFQGHKDSDIVTFTRIRLCTDRVDENSASSNANCTTVAVDDYRYESGAVMTNAPDVFPVVAILRVFGQVYMWLRLVLLFGGCFYASKPITTPVSRGGWQWVLQSRVFEAVRTLFLIPNQVIVYGSPMPILAYAVAHLIDSPAVYDMVDNHFDSWLGNFDISVGPFIRVCSVSMRTVWTLALACHVLLYFGSDHKTLNVHGAPGIPEFSITVIACLTMFKHYRSARFRSTKVIKIQEIVPSQRRRQGIRKSLRMSRSTMFQFLAGTPLDAKSITCVLLVMLAVVVIVWVLNRLFPERIPFVLTLWSRSVVPYSAGPLWIRTRLMVSWLSHVVRTTHAPGPPSVPRVNPSELPSATRLFASFTSLYGKSSRPKVMQHDVQTIDSRTKRVQSTVFLINLAAMTDPITFLNLRVVGGHPIGIFRSKRTGHRLLLPNNLVGSSAEFPVDWSELELIEVVNSKHLPWRQLLSCG